MIYHFWLLIWYLLTIVLSVLLWFTTSDYSLGIFWPLYCLSSFTGSGYSLGIFWPLHCLSSFDLRLLIIQYVYFDHCIVCPLWFTASNYSFGIFWSLFIVLSVLLWFTGSDYSLGIFWPLYCLSSFDLRFWLLIRYLLTIVLSVLFDLRLLIIHLVSFDHCLLYCLSSFDLRFWLLIRYLLTIVIVDWFCLFI